MLRAADQTAILRLLGECGLPTEDLSQAPVERLGVIGLDRFANAGLLRSLAVGQGARGHGLGAKLVLALEQHAAATGIDALVLLTQTAEDFFARHDYRRIERNGAPAAVRESGKFRSLCPASALCMTKKLVATGSAHD